MTGASQGFGLALTTALATRKWTVIGDARDGARLHAALRDAGDVRTVAGDVNDPSHRRALVAAAVVAGGLALLVHNASGLGPSPLPALTRYPLADLTRVLETNLVAPLALTQLALPLLRRSANPTVVTLSSDAAVEAYPGWGGYGASKAGLDHVASVLAVEHPEVRVYAFDPGDMRTDMHQRAFPGEDISDRQDPSEVAPRLLQLLEQRPPSGRYRAADVDTQAAA